MLKQGEMSVVDFEREFSRLSIYVVEYVPTEADSRKRFLRGLCDELRVQLVYLKIIEFANLVERSKMVEQVLGLDKKPKVTRLPGKRTGTTSSTPQPKRSKELRGSWRPCFRTEISDKNRGKQMTFSTGSIRGPSRNTELPECEHYGNRHQGECWKLTGGRFCCGSIEHFVKDCLKNKNVVSVTSQRSESASRGQGSSRGGSVIRGGARRGSDIATHQSEGRVPARAYVVRTRDEGNANDVVTEPVYVLIDLGSSHSYVNTKLVESKNLKTEMSKVSIAVSSPLGQTVLVNQVYRTYPLMIQDKIFSVDLLIMPFGDFDIILGMDWLPE
ncbi:zf-CCHC domain-containing protein/RVP_2 domain-containing protein [Gossypium australe]|uniref:Zf-CCHC domain-containing protein/RVP_2 domain-containing protein n=1 Tax=Gossypium australe TaxID=47621 RepID=A0A5B6UUY1_9ROSI|nr:zf-CCHC domain-containing protein/RVP_2 domain-containing protein [Gossypium australe]